MSLRRRWPAISARPSGRPRYPAEWPDTLPTPDPAPELCAVLHPAADGTHRIALADDPVDDATADGPRTRGPATSRSNRRGRLCPLRRPRRGDRRHAVCHRLGGLQVRADRRRGAGLHRVRRHRPPPWCRAPGWSSSTTRSSCRSTWPGGCPRTRLRRTPPPRGHESSRRRGVARCRSGRAMLPLVGSATSAVQASPYAAEDAFCFEGALPEGDVLADSTAIANPPLERMHVPEAQEITTGAGVKVAAIDSGIQDGLGINLAGSVGLPDVAGHQLMSGHGTIVGGLISGKDGVAPGAQVLSIRAFDSEEADVSQGEKPVTSQAIAQGIQLAIDTAADPQVQGRQHLPVRPRRRPGAQAGDQGPARPRRGRRRVGGQRRRRGSGDLQGHARQRCPRLSGRLSGCPRRECRAAAG